MRGVLVVVGDRLALFAHVVADGPVVAVAVSVGDVGEVVYLGELELDQQVERVHGGVAPALVVEAAALVQVLEEVEIGGIAPQRERGQLEVVPEVEAIQAALVVAEAVGRQHGRVHAVELLVARPALVHPALDVLPQARYGVDLLAERNGEAVQLARVDERAERIARDRTRKAHVRIETQVVVVLDRQRVAEKEARVEAAHVVIVHVVAVRHPQSCEQRGVDARHVDPLGHAPLLFGYEAELDGGARVILHRALERVGELGVVEQHVRIVVASVERLLELGKRCEQISEVALAHQEDNACVDSIATTTN